MRGRRGRDDASAASVAVLSHEAHVVRILASPALNVSDLGRAACVCRVWRAAVGRDDALFEAALWRDSPALAAVHAETLTCRALAAAVRAALGVPRSRAPAWAQAAVRRPRDWTLVADVFDTSALGNPRTVFSVAIPVTSLSDHFTGDEEYIEGQELCACAWHVNARAGGEQGLTLDDLVADLAEFAELHAEETEPSGSRDADQRLYSLRLLALHRTGKAAVICSLKKSSGASEYPYYTAWEEQGPSAMCQTFDAAFGTGPRVSAHMMFFPSPVVTQHPRGACMLGFTYYQIERTRHYDGPDSASESGSKDDWEKHDEVVTQQQLLRVLMLGPLRWTP